MIDVIIEVNYKFDDIVYDSFSELVKNETFKILGYFFFNFISHQGQRWTKMLSKKTAEIFSYLY